MEAIRLNKYLGDYGICSRREADRLIAAGKVLVDGAPASMGMKIEPGQIVVCDGVMVAQTQARPEPVLLMVNKPRGIVCTTSQKDRAKNIVELVNYPDRLYPMGRLDKDSEGLVLMTNQGDLVNKMMRGGNLHEKEYLVTVDKPVTEEFLAAMGAGVPILDTVTRSCEVEAVGTYSFRIILTQGLNRQIRRMCEYLDYQIRTLQRMRIMNLELGTLKSGAFRPVSEGEYQSLLKLLKDSSNLACRERSNEI